MSQTCVTMCQTVFQISHVSCTAFVDDAFADINITAGDHVPAFGFGVQDLESISPTFCV